MTLYTIDQKFLREGRLALKIPNLFMSKLFAQCTADIRLKQNKVFTDSVLDISALQDVKDVSAPLLHLALNFK